MYLVSGGPKIPQSILAAHEAGRLAIICGAGISRHVGLPAFKGLVEEVRERLGCDNDDVGKAVKAWAFDRALELLELHFGRTLVRRHVQDILAVEDDADVGTHEALLALARTAGRKLQLVTTNFDRLFELADGDTSSNRAPALPVPKPGLWDGLIYLHGKMDARDPDGEHLVMTTADFGRAYLVDGWASRFVSALFANYTVLFVGYSVEDPVMRYLVDAIAADRFLDIDFGEAYAFVGLEGDRDEGAMATEWAGKHVTPIPYLVTDGGRDHSKLHETLRTWAGLHAGGIDSRRNVAYDLGRLDPTGLAEEDRSRFLWAVEDASVADHLASLGPETSLGWADVLGERLLAATIDHEQRAPLVGWSAGETKLDDVSRALARWLASHVADPDLVRWVVGHGSHLHPEFASSVRYTLGSAVHAGQLEAEGAVVSVWSALLRGDALDASATYDEDSFALVKRLSDEEWSPRLRRDSLWALRPGLVYGRSLSTLFGSLSGDSTEAEAALSVSELANIDVGLVARGQSFDIVEAIESREDKDAVLADLSADLASALRCAVDLLAALGLAGQSYDRSYSERPSIAPHNQNRSSDDWTALIELNRLAFESLMRTDRPRAERLVSLWKETDYPVFRRLVLHAAGLLMVDDDG